MFNIVTVLFLTVLSVGCRNSDSAIDGCYLPQIEVNGAVDGLIEIKEWFAVGPFDFNPQKQLPEETFFNKDLRRYGVSEKNMDMSVAKRLIRRKAGFNISGQSSRISLVQYSEGDVSVKSNFYLFVSIFSTAEQAVSLVFDGSNSYNVWLNGEKLLEVTGKYNVNKVGDRFVDALLNEGDNLLAVKINRGSNVKSWDLFCAVADAKTAKDIYRANYRSDFIVNPIADDSLGFYLGPYTKASVSISDVSGKLLFNSDASSKTYIALPNECVDGFYNCTLTLPGNIVMAEIFYKGSFLDFVDKTSELIRERGYKWPSAFRKDIDVGYKRLIYLIDKPDDPVSSSQQRLIDRNRVLWGYSLRAMLSSAAIGSDEAPAGTFLRSFSDEYESLGDGFISFIPKSFVAEEKTALVMVVPYALDGESIISDWYTDNLDQIMADNQMADEYGFAMAWMYSGGKNYSLSAAVEEANAVVERMRELLCGKLGPIYIAGDCEGARRAMLIAEAEPEMFSGIALTSPIVSSFANEESPLNAIGNLRNIPVIAKHGVNDITSPVENSRRLVVAANNANVDVTYIETDDGHLTFSKDYRRYAFEFFEKINEKAE